MADKPRATVRMNDFPGIMTNMEKTDIPPGAAAFQLNLMSKRQGEMETRPGFRPVTFDED